MESTSVRLRNWAGEISLFADYYLHLFGRIFRKTPSFHSPDSILVVEIAGIGDTIGATPVIHTLKKYYPKAKIDLLVTEELRSLLKNHPSINNIISYNNQTLQKIKKRYNLAVLLAPGSREISRLLKDAKIPFRIGCTKRGITQGKGFYLTRKAKPLKGITHTINNNLNVLKTIGINIQNIPPKLYTTKKEDSDIELFLKKHGISKKNKLVLIIPGSKNIESIKHPSHLWPEGNFAEVGDILSKKSKIIILGSNNEINLVSSVSTFMKKDNLPLVDLSLRQIMALIKRANLVISADSGLMHIAESLNTPLIALFGPQNPERWKPLSKNSTILYNNKVCTGCQRYYCKRKNNICMTSITPKEVLREAKI